MVFELRLCRDNCVIALTADMIRTGSGCLSVEPRSEAAVVQCRQRQDVSDRADTPGGCWRTSGLLKMYETRLGRREC